jgi:hypothetical protein
MQASIAAAEHAERLDPKMPTSIAHTYFMRGDYARVLDYPPEGIPYIRNLALVMLDRRAEAMESIATIETSLPNRLVSFVTALRDLLLDKRESSLERLAELCDMKDPEGRFYVARQMAYLGDSEGAIRLLAQIVEDGFICHPALTHDPWLDPLRATPEFLAILRRSEARHRQAVISFLTAEGDRVLGVTQPV